MTHRKLVFLDIDGVLNSDRWLKQVVDGRAQRPVVLLPDTDGHVERRVLIQRSKVKMLNLLLDPSVEWVLSSTWRGDGGTEALRMMQSILGQLGWLGTLIDSTPLLFHDYLATRGEEIATWLHDNGVDPETNRIVILDDDCDVDPLRSWLVQVDADIGLRSCDIARARSLLEI
jgi:hypothetical protein